MLSSPSHVSFCDFPLYFGSHKKFRASGAFLVDTCSVFRGCLQHVLGVSNGPCYVFQRVQQRVLRVPQASSRVPHNVLREYS